MSRPYDKAVIKSLMQQETSARRIIEHFFPEARVAPEQQGYVIGSVAGGEGRSCALRVTGDHAGSFHDFNPGADHTHGDLIEAVRVRTGMSFPEALQQIGHLLGASAEFCVHQGDHGRPPRKLEPRRKPRRTTADLKPANTESLIASVRELQRDDKARAYLRKRGLSEDTISHFSLGVFSNRKTRDGLTYGPVISVPVNGENGKPLSAYAWYTVKGWTQGKNYPRAACSGGPFSTWDGSIRGKDILFVAEGMKDQWRLHQEIAGTALAARMAILSSTHGSALPPEWEDPAFWASWKTVYLGHDNDTAGEKGATKIASLARRDFHRVMVPLGNKNEKDWTDFFRNGGDLRQFDQLLMEAEVIGLPGIHDPERGGPSRRLEEMELGDHADRRIYVNGAFVGGFMYYPFRVRVVEAYDEKGKKVEEIIEGEDLPKGTQKVSYYVTRILRSDGRIMNYHELPAPQWVSKHDRVIALDDGTEVMSIPDPDSFCTWRLDSIRSYRDAMQNKRRPHRNFGNIVADVEDYLMRCVWLPNRNDFALLAAYVAMSYVYNAFEAIPMLLATGEKGSGKSTTAKAVAGLSFNGIVMGAGSEAALIRFVDQGRGLVVLDDIEKVGRPTKNENGLGDINEVLKVSYDKDTAVKIIVEGEGSTKRNRRLEFFGPKMLTNITGIDPVNATRLFVVMCRPMPEAMRGMGGVQGIDTRGSEKLRQELHAWGMARIRDVATSYKTLFPSRDNRKNQIAAPLLTIAAMTEDKDFEERVKSAIRAQDRHNGDSMTAEDVLREAVDAIIARGSRKGFSLPQVQLELSLNPDAQMLTPAHQVDEEFAALQNPIRLGRLLGSIGARSEKAGKVNLCGKKVKTYELDPHYLEAALRRIAADNTTMLEDEKTSKDPIRSGTAFCDNTFCDACPYQHTCKAVVGLRDAKKQPNRSDDARYGLLSGDRSDSEYWKRQ